MLWDKERAAAWRFLRAAFYTRQAMEMTSLMLAIFSFLAPSSCWLRSKAALVVLLQPVPPYSQGPVELFGTAQYYQQSKYEEL